MSSFVTTAPNAGKPKDYLYSEKDHEQVTKLDPYLDCKLIGE